MKNTEAKIEIEGEKKRTTVRRKLSGLRSRLSSPRNMWRRGLFRPKGPSWIGGTRSLFAND